MQPSNLVARIIEKVRETRSPGLSMIMERVNEFPSELQAQLTGIALDSGARDVANKAMDRAFRTNRSLVNIPGNTDELIIGSGFHAAVYAATRVLLGKQMPLILESAPTIGGVFAIPGQDGTYPGVFNLNSRNRRGFAGISRDNEAQLNYLPGAPIQASALSNAEYQTNADMAFIIRLTFAQSGYTRVFPSAKVISVDDGDDTFAVTYSSYGTNDERVILAKRVIDSTGLGDPKNGDRANGESILTFPQFMNRMTGMWPLRGLRNVAVIGGGDSGKCAVESFLGLAPQSFMSAAELDTVNRLDWFANNVESDYEDYCRANRGRYRAIGRYLRPDAMGNQKLNVFNQVVSPIALPSGGVLINGRQYDLVVIATGNDRITIPGMDWFYNERIYADDARRSRVIAVRNEEDFGQAQRFRIGPRAEIDFDSEESANGVSDIGNNRVAMFRLATRTAVLATKLS